MLDRLLHHCHVAITDGASYRMKTSPSQRRNQAQQQLETSEEVGTFNWPPTVTTNCPLTLRNVDDIAAATTRHQTAGISSMNETTPLKVIQSLR
jgi:hypothetical protein